MLRLYLARHGETEENRLGIIQGKGQGKPSVIGKFDSEFVEKTKVYGSPLNNNGILQAYKLGNALASINFNHSYTSPAVRAIQTLQQITVRQDLDNSLFLSDVEIDLIEIDQGIFEGMKPEEISRNYPELYKMFKTKPSQMAFPGGESIQSAYGRIGRVTDEIIEKYPDGNILVVSHGGTMSLIFAHILKLDIDAIFHAVRHHNCGLSIIEWKDDIVLRPRIICVNDTCHLKEDYLKRLDASN